MCLARGIGRQRGAKGVVVPVSESITQSAETDDFLEENC